MTKMKPLIYGYMRVPNGMDDQEVRLAEKQLANFAEVEGFTLASIFYEYETGSLGAFDELITELKRAEAHAVVVPSMEWLADNAFIRSSMVVVVEERAGATLHDASRS